MADKKPPEGEAPGSPGEAPGGGEYPEMGSMGGDDILARTLLTSAAAAKAANDDLKNIMGHGKGDAGGGDLGDIHLQDTVSRTSDPLELSSNVLKKMSSTAGSIMTSSEGGGGAGQSKKKRRWGLLAALLFVGIAVFVVACASSGRGGRTHPRRVRRRSTYPIRVRRSSLCRIRPIRAR